MIRGNLTRLVLFAGDNALTGDVKFRKTTCTVTRHLTHAGLLMEGVDRRGKGKSIFEFGLFALG
jgi:hypothetical protein